MFNSTTAKLRLVVVGLSFCFLSYGIFRLSTGDQSELVRSVSVPDKAPTQPPVAEPKPLDETWKVQTREGKLVRLVDVVRTPKPQWTLLHYWATWCPPCVDELIALEEFTAKVPEVRLVQVSVDYRWDEVGQFLAKLKLPWKTWDVLDPAGKVAKAMGTAKFPETHLVDPQGNVVARYDGPQNWTDPNAMAFFRRLATEGVPTK